MNILESWQRLMTGRHPDPLAFVDALLSRLSTAPSVSGTVVDSEKVGFSEGADEIAIAGSSAKPLLRMVCARLAVVFALAAKSEPNMYGGSVEATLDIEGAPLAVRLEFQNVSSEVWFKITVK